MMMWTRFSAGVPLNCLIARQNICPWQINLRDRREKKSHTTIPIIFCFFTHQRRSRSKMKSDALQFRVRARFQIIVIFPFFSRLIGQSIFWNNLESSKKPICLRCDVTLLSGLGILPPSKHTRSMRFGGGRRAWTLFPHLNLVHLSAIEPILHRFIGFVWRSKYN